MATVELNKRKPKKAHKKAFKTQQERVKKGKTNIHPTQRIKTNREHTQPARNANYSSVEQTTGPTDHVYVVLFAVGTSFVGMSNGTSLDDHEDPRESMSNRSPELDRKDG
ncbi:hypothetical protein WN48_08300 [Eufriesea mexicana]|uniref:Uncharacterized protein n=1 Tax=Eufriesea mexicana TaxID=516756 RepID=A0A310S806_9HYME|nr:hypothetical protein WN48_08300 [Eufriesea mexicana]